MADDVIHQAIRSFLQKEPDKDINILIRYLRRKYRLTLDTHALSTRIFQILQDDKTSN